jgi:hypothetical protein
LANLAQGTVCKILDQEEVKPRKVRYYLEQRDPDFAEKMAEVLCVYRHVKIRKQAAAGSKRKRPSEPVPAGCHRSRVTGKVHALVKDRSRKFI